MVQPSNEAAQSEPTPSPTAVDRRVVRKLAPRFEGLPRGPLDFDEAKEILEGEDVDARRLLLAEILSFAGWEEIWRLVSPEEVALALPELELPGGLKDAWSRWLESVRG